MGQLEVKLLYLNEYLSARVLVNRIISAMRNIQWG